MRYFTDLDDAVVVAVETTGPDPETDRIVSVSLLRVQFSTLHAHPDYLKGETRKRPLQPPVPDSAGGHAGPRPHQ